ncbi:3194_t:CDS:2 [Gigaspora rosea]|nr:3194_t:CDS:2 [Gigaspora rosea]
MLNEITNYFDKQVEDELHIIQLLLLKRFTYQERKYTFSFAKGSYGDENGEEQIEKRTFAVCGGATMEVCGIGNHDISLEFVSMVFKFQKFHNRSKTVFINGGSHLLVNITAPVRCEEGVNLSVQFDVIRKDIRPIESTLKPLGVDRNIFSDSRRINDTAEKPTGVKNYLEKGERQAVFIGSEYDYLVYPKDSKPGDLLLERLSFVNS